MTVDSIKTRLAGNKAVAIQMPIGAEDTFEGIVDLVEMKAYKFEGKMGENVLDRDFPEELRSEAEALQLELMEKAAEQDEVLMEKYIDTV